jgi:amino acid adenylation domain-containing protein
MRGLAEVVLAAARRHADRPALVVDGVTYTYRELVEGASAVAALVRRADEGDARLCAVHAERSFWSYAGILGILMAGRGYVPLGPGFPAARNRTMLERSGATTVIADSERVAACGEVLAGIERPMTVIAPEEHSPPGWAEGSRHRVLVSGDLPAGEAARHDEVGPDSTAYLLFTSGTTGEPKGIGIAQSNVGSYLEAMAERVGLTPEDRCTQNFALTFDLSVHDMFVTWSAGACLCVPPAATLMAPAAFVREQAVTCWFSTPSTAGIMMRLRLLRPGSFPDLRRSIFCGEALTCEVAEAWFRAAPDSVVDNIYGPTEATIACTGYIYRPGTRADDLPNGVVPIGRPFGGTRVQVVGEDLRPVAPGELGELLLGGPQVAGGYWRDPERTARAFVSPAELGEPSPWYRTGDLVALSPDGDLVYHGRADDQIKIRGHRVELQEVESVIRAASRAAIVVAMGWPRTAAGADGVIAFLSGAQAADEEILDACRRAMPGYMVPSRLHHVEDVPQNASGKVDRRRLLALAEG